MRSDSPKGRRVDLCPIVRLRAVSKSLMCVSPGTAPSKDGTTQRNRTKREKQCCFKGAGSGAAGPVGCDWVPIPQLVS